MSELSFSELSMQAKNIVYTQFDKHSRKVTNIEAELSLVSYPDFVVTKRTAQQTKMLVVMPTQDTYYIKTSKGKSDPIIEQLNVNNLIGFVTNIDRINLPEGFWVERLPENKAECELFVGYLTFFGIADMLKYNAAPSIQYSLSLSRNEKIYERYKSVYDEIPTLFKEYGKEKRFTDFVKNNHNFLVVYNRKYGLDCTKRFVSNLMRSLVSVNQWLSYYVYTENTQLLDKYYFEPDRFAEYVLYDSVTMGYANQMRRFFQDWVDCLRMQEDNYGKVKEKYSTQLPLLHNQLSYKSYCNRSFKKEEMFAKQSELSNRFEAQVDGYVFIAPKRPDDFREEAVQQANCLASYIDRFAEGNCYIMFMRKKETPEKSLVTIQLSPKGYLIQNLQARNKPCTEKQELAISKWMKYIRNFFDNDEQEV